MNFFLTAHPTIKFSSDIDFCLAKDAEGDEVKFHQTMIAILDFALKYTDCDDVALAAEYDKSYGGFNVSLEVPVTSKLVFDEHDLKTIFSMTGEVSPSDVKVNQMDGLPISLTAKLLMAIGGSFTTVKNEDNEATMLRFVVPFKTDSYANNQQVHGTLQSVINNLNNQDSLIKINSYGKDGKGYIQNTQESGNDGSLLHKSNEMLESINEAACRYNVDNMEAKK